ncbi:TIGR01621 family pseudouridine synthase [Chitinibacter fontanus]|uniref:TIGR01621 family pseudouridine synthase n=1 Tax=Chitinibacter fontanus TaxID=1737446 RepID=A0A7D5ZKJ7_9NEIS|nr:TIGR01621 family pseudouridine synthase [Chitinibacter fontanus]
MQPEFIVINKPANLDFHHTADQISLVDLVRIQTGLTELFTVHRLDKMTSGILLLARSSESARYFSQLFAEHRIQKYYLALSDKKPSKKQGWVKGGMEKGRNGSWKLVRDGGLSAVTQFFSYGLGEGQRLFVLKPLSGRTHQLRVAMKSLGSPILGDERYAGTAADRGYLHAYAIEFIFANQHYQYIAPPNSGDLFQTPQLLNTLTQLGHPSELAWPK